MKICVSVDNNKNITEYAVIENGIKPFTDWIEVETDLDLDMIYLPNNYKLINGQLIELTEEEKINIDEIKANKILEISTICEDKIINEFYSSCLGEKKKFDCTRDDQTYIMGLASKAQLILSGVATDKILDWKASGEPVCYSWEPQQALMLGQDLFNHLTEKKKRYEQIREYILTKLSRSDEVNAVAWDIVIPQEGDVNATQTTV